MTIFIVAAALSFVALAALVGRALLERPSRSAFEGGRVLPPTLPASDAAREQIAALVPSGDAIVSGPPPVDLGPMLAGVRAGVSVSVDLNLVGVTDDRDAVDRELWLATKEALAKRRA